MADGEELVTVREAAHRANVPFSRIHNVDCARQAYRPARWAAGPSGLSVRRGGSDSRHSPISTREPVVPPPNMDEYVPPSVAARVVDIDPKRVSIWVSTGRVATKPGARGQLVRLADVLAVAAHMHVRRDIAGEAGA